MSFRTAGHRHQLTARLSNRIWLTPVALASFLFVACAPAPSGNPPPPPAVGSSQKPVVFPDFIADPAEPFNRGMWEVNRALLTGVLQPSSRVYRTVVPTPARQSIGHFTRNITYPGRLVNHLLQGRWQGAGDESLRFLTNTTVGVAGFFDVATQWEIPKSAADFSQTFGTWGWKPNQFVMLPFLGPSDDQDAVGSLADRAVSPWTYLDPAYAAGSFVGTFNGISDRTETTARFTQSESDAYVGTKYIWSYVSKDESPDWTVSGPKHPPTLETLGVAFIQNKDPRFIEHGRQLSVTVPSTGRKMKYNLWLQRGRAPLAFVSPGLGSHRVSAATLSIAEALYDDGFSVVTVAGIFHPEFMENASTRALPAYPPYDCQDLLAFLTELDRSLEKRFPDRIGKKALIGFSMGGFQALHLAAREKTSAPDQLRFDRYVALDTPVNLHYGDKVIDDYCKALESLPAATRQDRANNAVHKAAKMVGLPPEMRADPPFDASESKYLVGMSFRLTLRDTIFSSQRRENMGILSVPPSRWNRAESYREIYGYTFRDYFLNFALPYYEKHGITATDFARENDLRTYTKQLRTNPNSRVIVNSNDFIINSSDISWLKSTFGPSRVTIFPSGGHMGNIATPEVQTRLLEYVRDLK